MGPVERITANEQLLCYIVRADINPERTAFLTPPELNVQVGHIVYPAGHQITRHLHLPVKRQIIGTSEVLIVRKGRCEIDIYDDKRHLVATRELRAGDIMIMAGGGHGFRMLEDTILLEVKQGPYPGMDEKEQF